jgi:primosomal protein N' (replication factor Y) (superfamily II helicase)
VASQAPTARTQGPRRRPARNRPAASLPVARVAVEVPLAHLDRPFDYLVPEHLDDLAVPGCRVRIRFAGRLTGGFLLERTDSTDHQGTLSYLERVVSAEPVLTAEIAGLARAVADRYGGTLADVLRLAIPPRHAGAAASMPLPHAEPRGAEPGRAEPGRAEPGPGRPGGNGALPGAVGLASAPAQPGSWGRYRTGPSFLTALADGRSPRAVWSPLPGSGWPTEIALAVAAVAASERGALVIVPDAADLELVDGALTAVLPPGTHVVLAADLGPAERYRRWLSVARGDIRVVAGTRSAAFAPVLRLGLVVLWDEGNDLHAEPRAPYPHAREVLALRAHRSGAAALIGGFGRTAEAALLVEGGWARSLAADRATVRQHAPAVLATGELELARDEAARSARLPGLALRTAREALAAGPVLFQVPRRGYLAAVACERCRARARCDCGGPAQLPGPQAPLRCGWCGSELSPGCRNCGHVGLRALVTGAGRTAEELARAFPSVQVRSSGGSSTLRRVGAGPAIVVATPGAEPVVESGYSAAILVDGWAMLGMASLRAGEEALRRWLNAAALVRPGRAGGKVVVVADAGQRAVQALVRWDPVTFAGRELAERAELRFPPATRMAALTGPADAVQGLLEATELPDGAELLGPLPLAGELVRYLVRVQRACGADLARAMHAGQAARSAAKAPGAVRVHLDPVELI